jgi:hypothetical protein
MQQLKEIDVLVQAAPNKQISLTDPDARSMAASGGEPASWATTSRLPARNRLIVAHEVTNVGNDRGQLASMARQAQTAMGRKDLEVNAGMTPFVPKPLTSSSKAEGRFGKQDFVYVAEDDTYRCPAGERLTSRSTSVEDGMILNVYWTSACQNCSVESGPQTSPLVMRHPWKWRDGTCPSCALRGRKIW